MTMVVATLAATMALAQQPFDLDLGFQTEIMTSGVTGSQYVNSLHVLADGNLFVSGRFHFTGDATLSYFKKLTSSGNLDTSFPNVFAGGGRIAAWSSGFYVGT